jgi:hypothetical protein
MFCVHLVPKISHTKNDWMRPNIALNNKMLDANVLNLNFDPLFGKFWIESLIQHCLNHFGINQFSIWFFMNYFLEFNDQSQSFRFKINIGYFVIYLSQSRLLKDSLLLRRQRRDMTFMSDPPPLWDIGKFHVSFLPLFLEYDHCGTI